MSLVPTIPANDVAEVEMASDSSPLSVRVTVVQASTVFYDTPATLDKAERLLAEAAGFGSRLVVFPEAFVGGYPRGSNFGVTMGSRTKKGKDDFIMYHAAAIDVPGPEVDRLAAMAGKYKVYLVMGVIERDGYTLYCTVLFFDSEGRYLGKHRKVMPTALERIIWGFGDGSTMPVFETPLGKIGAAICWENRMPLLRTALYAKGIQIYCAPTADSRDVWQASMKHIAVEGGCFVLSSNQFCQRKDYPPSPAYTFQDIEEDLNPDSVVCAGGSVIISPSGTVLAGPNYEGQALITADLDIGEIAREKFAFDVIGHYSRPEVFSLIMRDEQRKPVTFASEEKEASGRYLGKHRKVMPTAMERFIRGSGDGSTIPVFETPLEEIGTAIGWESRIGHDRIQIYCAPTADSGDAWQASMKHVAVEGGCFVLSSNQLCRRKDYPPSANIFSDIEKDLNPETVVCAGGSVIISPSRTVLAGPQYEPAGPYVS